MLTVLAEDEGYVVVAKPPGRIVVPGRGAATDEPTIRAELEAQRGARVLVVHRLDRWTSGALLFATDPHAHRALCQAFEQHRVVKHYWAVVRGLLMGTGEIDVALVPVRGGLMRAAHPGETGGKPSRTAWRAMERIGGYTIVDFRPLTGRLHQIRVHAAAMGHPLAVDPQYGRRDSADTSGPAPFDRTPLHAISMKFPHPGPGRKAPPVTVDAPLPEDLLRGVDLLRRGAAMPPPR